MGNSVGGGEAVSVIEAHQRRGGQHGGGGQEQPAGRQAARDGRPEQVELLLDGEAPSRTDAPGQSYGPEVLDKKHEKEPWSGGDVVQQPADGPDAKEAAGIKSFVEARGGTGVENDPGDEEAGEDEEETDSAPAPDHEFLQKGALQAGFAMIEEDGEDCDAAQSIEGGNEGGQPCRALAGRRSGAGSGSDFGFARWDDCRGH